MPRSVPYRSRCCAMLAALCLAGAAAAEDLFRASSLTPASGPTVRALADLAPSTLAVMHGSTFSGDGAAALRALADDYDRRVADVAA